jgi:hypothetical protein
MLKEKVVSFGDQFAKVYYDNHKLRVVSDPFEARYSRGFWDYTVRSEAGRTVIDCDRFDELQEFCKKGVWPHVKAWIVEEEEKLLEVS